MKIINAPTNQFAKPPDSSAPTSIPIHWLNHLFGCWHRKMGTPFTQGSQTYCTCMECGARRKYDTVLWKYTGPYYYTPVLALYDVPSKTVIGNSKPASVE